MLDKVFRTVVNRRQWISEVGAVAGGALAAGGVTPAEAAGRDSPARVQLLPTIRTAASFSLGPTTPIYEAIPFGVFVSGAPTLWARGYQGDGVKVGIVDSGIDVRHPTLANSVTLARDFVGDTPDVNDWYWHGTHVAGVIAADSQQAEGVLTGVAPHAELLDYRVIGRTGTGQLAHAVAAIYQAVNDGCNVLYLGFGLDQDTVYLRNAIRRARQAHVLVVAGAGDLATGGPRNAYPGAYEDVVPVMDVDFIQGATFADDRMVVVGGGPAAPNVLLAHDGGYVVSTAITFDSAIPQFIVASGASIAAAYVAGMAAVLLQKMRQRTRRPVSVACLRAALETTGVSLAPYLDPSVTVDPSVGFATFYPELPRRVQLLLPGQVAPLGTGLVQFELPSLLPLNADSSNPNSGT